MPSKKQAVAYRVRRPLTLWGRKRNVGEVLSLEEVTSVVRIESMVRAGRLDPIYDEGARGEVQRGRTGIAKPQEQGSEALTDATPTLPTPETPEPFEAVVEDEPTEHKYAFVKE